MNLIRGNGFSRELQNTSHELSFLLKKPKQHKKPPNNSKQTKKNVVLNAWLAGCEVFGTLFNPEYERWAILIPQSQKIHISEVCKQKLVTVLI